LSLKSWVRLKDGVYNRTVLHPDGSELQGAKGLMTINKTIAIAMITKTIIKIQPHTLAATSWLSVQKD